MSFLNKILVTLSVVGMIATGNNFNNKPSITHMKLNAGIITPKLKESKAFYQQVLNFSIKFENDWYVLLETPGGADYLSFMEPGHPGQQPVFQTRFEGKGVYFTVEVDDVDKEYERIKALKIPIEVELRDEAWGDRHFSIVDPNGIGIDIVEYTPPEK